MRITLFRTLVAGGMLAAASNLHSQCIVGDRIMNNLRITDPTNFCNCGAAPAGPTLLHLLHSGQPTLRLSSNPAGGCVGQFHGTITLNRGGVKYSAIEDQNDFAMVADVTAKNLLFSIRNPEGAIKFSTSTLSSPVPNDTEKMRLTPDGHLGIGTPQPSELLQIGTRLTFHVGANEDYIGYNTYTDGSNDERRLINGYASTVEMTYQGMLRLGSAGTGAAGSITNYFEANNGYKGLTVHVNSSGYGIVGIGRMWPESESRLSVQGFGATSATLAMHVHNSSGATALLVDDAQQVGIGTTTLHERFQVGSLLYYHDEGAKFLGFNAYFDGSVMRNVDGDRASVRLLLGDYGTDPDRFYITIDKEIGAGGGEVFDGAYKGITLNTEGDVAVGSNSPDARLLVKGKGTTSSTSALKVTSSAGGTPILEVRDDAKTIVSGDVGIGSLDVDSRVNVQGKGTSSTTYALRVANSTGTSPIFRVRDDGKAIIGEEKITSGTHTDFRLAVDGKIVAKHYVCTETGWADDVFRDGYDLMPLSTLASFIDENGHLPGVPTEAEVAESGVDVAKATVTLLRKVEELTLYLLELKKENEILRASIGR